MLNHITVIAFDLDDTLWPCMPTIRRAEQVLYQWLQQHYPRITEGFDPEKLVASRREFSAREARYAIDMTGMRLDFLQYIGEMHEYDGERVARDGFDVFFEARQQVEFYDDVLPCLQRLRRRYRLGAISNGNASVKHVGLGDFIEHSVGASEVMAAKPDPLIFEHLAKRFRVRPAEILYVGDHPHYDVAGSVDAGYQAVWINRENLTWPEQLPAPQHEVSDLHQLETLLTET